MFRFRDRVLAHLETWRPFISLNAGLTAIAGAALQLGSLPSPGQATVIFAVPVIGYLGALYGTDFKDRAADRETRPQRPIPSGRIGEDEAIIWMSLCMGIGFLGASWLGFPAVVMTCVALGVGVLRAVAKSSGLLAPFFRSFGTAANLLFGAVAIDATISPAVWLIALVFFADTFPKSVVGSLWDLEADRATGVRTPWVVYGVPRVRVMVFAALLALLALVVSVPFLIDIRSGPYYGFLVVFTGMVGMAAWRLTQVIRRPEAALSALNWLLRDRSILAGAVLAGVAGPVTAVLIVLPVVLLAEWSRVALMAGRMYRLEMPAMAVSGG
uniref:Putative 4-hydroxybenzoate octaprenyltransferase n=1 Tax=Streptomyces argenteolus TaxID=67274 RepID=A9ZNV3_9ACTN|nr:putative 4-hydroxybenzoate octaprenyltransferase [Streptomyces argenteolus]